ncbi:adenosylcobinamide kinase [Thioclava dalianensis]|uniref:Bifunctional adenosylcobalamin biosynthesis protein n=1 Tax=Thioclava dalianensis TaxID=1185766 RepID=A0A074T8V3_9RHOB|nr:bifunctional adenosylcobinamide kinase/adenosylcobinamide-phosphate guanylyltransferase [Thioclava dalianensis]KEP68149.1 adenosylcobinamide kinase [Thioclava dalianensis]
MSKVILITGGARSGKSALAERHMRSFPGAPVYIATAEIRDDEMAQRVALHRARRGPEWRQIDAPLDVVGALRDSDGAGPRLLDCLTLWLTNLMLGGHDWEAAGRVLAQCLSTQSAPVILVTNEVGAGIVPESALGRAFRDAAGLLNQRIAAISDEVYLAVSGLPMKVKP